MPTYVVQKTREALNNRSKPVQGCRVLLLGLAYKANVDDMRESPTFDLMDQFQELGAVVDYHDPHIPVITPTREHAAWTGTQSAPWTEENLRAYDVVVLATHHDAFDLQELIDWTDLIVDTRNAIAKSGLTPREGQVRKA